MMTNTPMATDRIAQILRVRSDYSNEQIAAMSDSEAWDWVYQQDQQEKQRRADAASARPQICFTGFSKSDRATLEAKAESLNLEVKASVTKTVRYLCTGPEAGPAKLIKAREQGAMLLSVEQFHALCETGEVPD